MLEFLPKDLLNAIVGFLEKKDLTTIASTSKKWRKVFYKPYYLLNLQESLLKENKYSCEITMRDKGVGFFSRNRIALRQKNFGISIIETKASISKEENIKNQYRIIIRIREKDWVEFNISSEIWRECALILILSAKEKLIWTENNKDKKINKKLLDTLPSIMDSLYLNQSKLSSDLDDFEEILGVFIEKERKCLKYLKKYDRSTEERDKAYKEYLAQYVDLSKVCVMFRTLVSVMRHVLETTKDHPEKPFSSVSSTYLTK